MLNRRTDLLGRPSQGCRSSLIISPNWYWASILSSITTKIGTKTAKIHGLLIPPLCVVYYYSTRSPTINVHLLAQRSSQVMHWMRTTRVCRNDRRRVKMAVATHPACIRSLHNAKWMKAVDANDGSAGCSLSGHDDIRIHRKLASIRSVDALHM